jgi:putative ABC transport system permease protein
MWADLRQAVRSLKRQPGFVCVAALVLALGIGLNTAMFSIVNALLFKPLPVDAPHDLLSIYMVLPRQPDRPGILHSTVIESFRAHHEVFTDLTAHWPTPYTLRVDGETDTVHAERVLSNYFSVLGVRPVMGRPFLATEDDVSNTERAVVISHSLWVRRFRADPTIVGRPIILALPWAQVDMPATVVGVMGPEFKGVAEPWKPTQLWITFAQGNDRAQKAASGIAIGRLKPGVTVQQAQSRIETLGAQAAATLFTPGYEPRHVVYRTNDVRVPADPTAALVPARLAAAMMMVVAMVLLVAATNIAGILLAKGVGRSAEIATRRIAGATPLRIVRQLLAESVLLTCIGGIFALVLAPWLLGIFRAVTPAQFAIDAGIDTRVVCFTTAVCLIAGIVVGVMPARQAMSADVLPWLAPNRSVQWKHARARMRHVITIPQVAVSLVLLLVSAAYVRELLRIEFANLGYATQNVVLANPVFRVRSDERTTASAPDVEREERYAERSRRFYRQLLDRLRVIPGAQDVAISDSLPLREPPERPNWSVVSQDDVASGAETGVGAERSSISPGYFRTMKITLRAGRDFDERDTLQTPKVAVVSTAMAQRLWRGRDAVGRRLTIKNAWAAKEQTEWYEVVGVVDDVRSTLHHEASRPFVYLALGQEWRPSSHNVLVRGISDSSALVPFVKAAVNGADPLADVPRIRSLAQVTAEILYLRRIAAGILATSGLVALLLATVGVYGVVSYSVAQRTNEIGVRMALGADRRDVERLLLAEGATVAAVGCIIGVVLSYTAIRVTSSGYLAVPQPDIATTLATSVLLAAVVGVACYLPSRRAGSLDPMNVLRRL